MISKIAEMRPKKAERRRKIAERRPTMAKPRPKTASTRPKTAERRPQDGRDGARESPERAPEPWDNLFFKLCPWLLQCDIESRAERGGRVKTLPPPLHVWMHAFWGFYRAFFKKTVLCFLWGGPAECATPGEPFKEGEKTAEDIIAHVI